MAKKKSKKKVKRKTKSFGDRLIEALKDCLDDLKRENAGKKSKLKRTTYKKIKGKWKQID